MFAVTISGEDQIINRMMAFNKDVWKVLQGDVKSASEIIAESARGLTPGEPTTHWTSGGRLGWNEASVDRSIKSKFRSRQIGRYRYVMGLVDMSNAAGSLFALAGSKTKTQFGDLLNADHGTKYPRAMGPAWRMHVDEAREGIQNAVNDAARKVAF